MSTFRLGINTCFGIKRWPRAEDWARIVSDELGLDLVQHSLDLVDLWAGADALAAEAELVRSVCDDTGLTLHSTFTGLAAYGANVLLDPRPELRERWEDWFRRAITFTALVGAPLTGGHVGAYTVPDWADEQRRAVLWAELKRSLRRLAQQAKDEGLDGFLVENLASAREPGTMAQIDDLLAAGDATHVPLQLCLDVGHQCVPGSAGRDRDPYAWLRAYAARLGAVHLQQSDPAADHHWAFTAAHNAEGRIEPDLVLDALEAGGAGEVALLFEIIPAAEQDDDSVLSDLVESARQWQDAIERRAHALEPGVRVRDEVLR